ncbi:hypothetical protein J2Z22_002844 [Paenibacillus forsythiae]|uniref:Putative amidase domain-containing protein n=1 Tax=Paenibacillus forsythiae TaxID=365616 RepID=A0ABU3H8Z7_9BACL|nr:amidase domain-containing protein [Paenibacillus forsythiae]MDT3427293.1 hypothetical protein [Paenibacillus forsythiae]
MQNRKKPLFGVICSLLIFSAPAYASEKIPDSKKAENPYVTQYFFEKFAHPNKTDLVDPVVEDQIAIDALTSYYNADVKVAGILALYDKDANLLKKATSLNKEDKIQVMHIIKKVYPSVTDLENQQALKGFLKRYAQNINEKESVNFLKEINPKENQNISINEVNKAEGANIREIKSKEVSEETFSIASSYNGTAAADWAYNHYNTYDSAFPAFNAGYGSDCTNFVSQALWHGGKTMADNWYSYKKNSTYLSPASAAELDYSWTLADPSPWISKDEFNDYWRPKSTVHGYSKDYYVSNHTSIYNLSIYKGDVLVFHNGTAGFVTWPTHVMIISGYDSTNKDFLLAGHSNNRQAYPLLTAISNYAYIEFFEIP